MSNRLTTFAVATVLVFAITKSAAADGLSAFPGAEGAGAYATGGRGGDVYYVTNLKDPEPIVQPVARDLTKTHAEDIPGSLRHAISSATGPRTIVFAVSGTIYLKSDLLINKSNLTIAGQTAPGDGICLADHGLVFREAKDVVVQYIRVRPGDNAKKELDAISVYSGEDMIIDHCSTSWSVDETLSVSPNPKTAKLDRVTVQWCMITESLRQSEHSKKTHGFAILARGSRGASYSYHHNLIAHHTDRSPRPGNYIKRPDDRKGWLFDFRNNVIYNWGRRVAGANHDSFAVTHYNFINNYYIPGPNTQGKLIFHQKTHYSSGQFSGNWMVHSEPAKQASLLASRISRLSTDQKPAKVATHTAPEAYKLVLAQAGASLSRDAVDRRIVNEVLNKTGKIIDDEDEVGGWPELKSLPTPLDTDQDGMPDAYEKANKLDPNDAADRNGDLNGDGYTNLENYLHVLSKTSR